MTKDLAKHLGKQLQIAREKKNLTQAEVAKAAGTNTNYYAKVERGDSIPSIKMLEKLANVLSVNLTITP